MEKGKLHNQHGFTLAEVLLSVAIILVLAAIAMPSIFNAQRNMHMVELDSAANQIALAAQNKMTSMKVSGTWLDALKDLGIDLSAQPAKNAPEGEPAQDQDERFYLTKEQINKLGILTSLSIDETVFEGDYIIEFVKSTASVYGVFYSDGRSGALWDDSTATGVMDTYYAQGTAATAADARLKNNPPIGYYGGTPAGATKAVALEHPNIYVDDMGLLCVQDTNVSEHSDYGMALQVTIAKQDGSAQFVISGIQLADSFYVVGLTEDDVDAVELSNTTEQIYKVGTRDELSASTEQNVFKIDLNELVTILSEKAPDELNTIISGFSPRESLNVAAKVEAKNKPSVPSESAANIEWPSKAPKIVVLATASDDKRLYPHPENDSGYPLSLAAQREDNGKKKKDDPNHIAVVSRENLEPITNLSYEELEESLPIGGKGNLPKEDPGSDAQFYEGIQVNKESVDRTVLFEITPGSVASNAAFGKIKMYYYQVFEIWINNVLVGSVQGIDWEWNSSYTTDGLFLHKTTQVLEPIDAVMPTLSKEHPAIYLDPMKLADSGIPLIEDGYTIYVRSAPSIRDVQSYLNQNVGNTPGDASSRTIGGVSKDWRRSFVGEFHTPSSIALWAIREGKIAGIENSAKDDICFYYAPTPFAKENDSMERQPLSSSILWALKTERESHGSGAIYSLYDKYIAVGQDYSNVAPPPAGLGEIDRPRLVGKDGSTDFAIRTDTPELYYRSIIYCDNDGKQLGNLSQWVPILGFDFNSNTTNVDTKFLEGPTKEDHIFMGWSTEPNGAASIKAGEKISDYRDALPLGAGTPGVPVKLYAQYIKAGIGLMYLEFDKSERDYYDPTSKLFDKNAFNDEKQIIGWEGYFSANQEKREGGLASNEQEIGSFGYYLIVPAGLSKAQIQVESSDYRDKNLINDKKGVYIDNVGPYDIYRLGGYEGIGSGISEGNVETRRSNRTVTYKYKIAGNEYQATYTFNYNFAAALVREKNEKANPALEQDTSVADPNSWGTEASPWRVRQALQYPDALSNNSTQNPQDIYSGSHFVQEHDIDIIDTARFNGFTFNRGTIFTGVYDGGGYSVKNVHVRFSDPATNYLLSSRAYGLFAAIENATIKNVNIIETPLSEDLEKWSVSSAVSTFTTHVGLLVGIAKDSVIQNCSAVSEGYGDELPTISRIDNVSSKQPLTNIGGLVGRIEGTKMLKDGSSAMRVVNCSFGKINLSITTKDNVPTLGSLVGSATGALIQGNDIDTGLTVSDTKLEVLGTSNKISPSMYFGSIVGKIDDNLIPSSLKGCVAANVSFVAPKRTDKTIEPAAFGGLVGWYTGLEISIQNSRFEKITSKYMDEDAISVEKSIGYQG